MATTAKQSEAFRVARALAGAELPLAMLATAALFVAGDQAGEIACIVGPCLIALLTLLWATGWIMGLRSQRIPPLALPVGLFVLSAGTGVWIAYEPVRALPKLGMILCGVGLFWAIARASKPGQRYAVLVFLALLASWLTISFLGSSPWDHYEVKGLSLAIISRQVASILPDPGWPIVNPNWAGGMLAMLLPFAVPLVAVSYGQQAARERRRPWQSLLAVVWLVNAGIVAFGLVVSASRGACAATVTAGLLWLAWRATGKLSFGRRLLVLAGAVLLVALAAGGLLYAITVMGLPALEKLATRWEIHRFSLSLARDYVFTGAGLTGFMMQLSAYAMLLPVGYVAYSHNTLLDILVGQGIVGLLAFAWAIAAGLGHAGRIVRARGKPDALIAEAAVASLIVVLVQGLVDNVVYQGLGLLLMWVPLALLASLTGGQAMSLQEEVRAPGRRYRRVAVLAVSIALIALLGLRWRELLGSIHANLGAVAQSQVELAIYDPNALPWRSLDQIRREEDLSRAIAHYERALSYNPDQVTARQRLAAIALARGDDAIAREHMDTVWQAGYRSATTRLLYGDALVATGDVNSAARALAGQPRAIDRLLDVAWSRYWEAGHWEQARDAWQTVLLIEPGHRHATYWAETAQQQLSAD
jgi:tetratricopeptide (TPR) repeat protein